MRWIKARPHLAPCLGLTLLALSLLPVPASSARGSGFKRNEFKVEYRDVLGRYADGDKLDAVASLVDLERRTSPDGSHLEPQWNAKLSVVRDLLSLGPDVLVPVTQLHQEAYLAHLERRSYSLAAHARGLTIELAELYAERARGEHRERLASAVMTSLAGHLHAAYMESNASALYRRAIDINPQNTAAYLGLVGILERHGDYEGALPLLRQVAEVDAADVEARLRLALHLVRLEQLEEAAELLEALVAEEVQEPRWVHSLAYQELGRLHLDRNDVAAALAIFERGVRAMPGDPTLPILYAYTSDRNGRPSSKAKLADALHVSASVGLTSPRYRYSQMPKSALSEVRAALAGESEAQLPTLAEALGDREVVARNSP